MGAAAGVGAAVASAPSPDPSPEVTAEVPRRTVVGGASPAPAPAVSPDTGERPPEAAVPAGISGTGEPPALRRVQRPEPPRGPRLSGWLIAAVIATGAALIIAGLLRSSDDEPASDEPVAEQPSEPTAPAEPGPAPELDATPGPGPGSDRPELVRRRLDRFAIGVPADWARSDGPTSGGFTPPGFAAPGNGAQIQVFYRSGGTDPSSLVPEARAFLQQRRAGAEIEGPEPVRLGGRRAVQLTASFDEGTERAVLASGAGYTYVILLRVSEGASDEVRNEADAVLRSFKPR